VNDAVLALDLPFTECLGRGKVREIYTLGDDLLLVATDRISAFDVVMAEGIPGKGRVLTETTAFWLDRLRDVVPNHMLSTDVDAWPEVPAEYRDALRGRAMRCRRCEPLPVEWVVRGYLTGSGGLDSQREGAVSGVALPAGLQHASRFEQPILTPSTKADSGHDEPIDFERVVELVGRELAERARDVAISLYTKGNEHANERGIVIADTKFEFGLHEGELMLIDECLTPDSSRFWPKHEVTPGGKPKQYDKQHLRNWLLQQDWDKAPPPPPLPADVVASTARTYQEIQERLTR
jgi:phosphoribosylaminoimidazole-succinocarboxamide synthase